MASNRKRSRVEDDRPETIADQHSRVMNEANDAAQRALGQPRKSWMHGASRSGATSLKRPPKVGLGRLASASVASGQVTSTKNQTTSTIPAGTQSLESLETDTVEVSGIDRPATFQPLSDPKTSVGSNSKQPHSRQHGNESVASTLSQSKNDGPNVINTTYISQATSLPSPASSTGPASPNNMPTPLSEESDAGIESRAITAPVLGAENVETSLPTAVVSETSIPFPNTPTQEVADNRSGITTDQERLQLLLHRFGGVDGLEKQLASGVEQSSTSQTAAVQPTEAIPTTTIHETAPQAHTALTVDLTSTSDASVGTTSPAVASSTYSSVAPLPSAGFPILSSDSSFRPEQNRRAQIPIPQGQPKPSATTRPSWHESQIFHPVQNIYTNNLGSRGVQQQGLLNTSSFTPAPSTINVPLQNQYAVQQPSQPLRRVSMDLPSQWANMSLPVWSPVPQISNNNVQQGPPSVWPTVAQVPNHNVQQGSPPVWSTAVHVSNSNVQQGPPHLYSQAHVSPPLNTVATPSPTLSAFIGWKGCGSHPGWGPLRTRIQNALATVRPTANTVHADAIKFQRLSELLEACQKQDVHFLLMSQTHAVSLKWVGEIPQEQLEMKVGLDVLCQIFSPAIDIHWFSAFPCQAPIDRLQLRQWFLFVRNDLETLGRQYGSLQYFCYPSRRLPYPPELESYLPQSTIMQRAIFKLFLGSCWPSPIDACANKALEAFMMTQRRRSVLRQQGDVHTQRQRLESETKQFIDIIAKYLNEHTVHQTQSRIVANAPQIHRTSNGSAEWRSATNPRQHQISTQAQVQGFSELQPGIGIPYSSAPLRGGVHPSAPLNLTRRLSSNNVDQISFELSDAELASQVVHRVNTNHNQGTSIPMFPQAPGELPRAPFHHAVLRDPMVNASNIFNHTTQYKAYVAGFFSEQSLNPLVISNKTPSYLVRFQVDEDATTKLARQKLSPEGAMVRKVDLDSQILRLRGTSGERIKTIDEWVTRETSWPAQLAVLLNGKVVEFRKKPQHTRDLPVDITSHIQPGVNSLEASFLWTQPPSQDFYYTLAIEVVVVTDKAMILSKVSTIAKGETETSLKKYFQASQDEDMEIIVDHLDVIVTDPFTSSLPKNPGRTELCQHLQCFDLEVFIDSRPSNVNDPDKFICPICSVDARPGVLRADQWMASVVERLREMGRDDAKMITIHPDLTWTIKEDVPKGKPDSKDAKEVGNEKTSSASTKPISQSSSSNVVEVIEID